VRAWLGGTLPPWAAHSAEAHVVGDVISEHALGDEPRWPIIKISPVPPASEGGKSDRDQSYRCCREEEEVHVPVVVVVIRREG
jgi:hypothetical protein